MPNADIGCAPRNFRPQPGEPGGGAIPSGEGLKKANYLLESLGLSYSGAKPVANFPPYADGKIFSPRTYLKSEATIFTEPNEPNIPINRYVYLHDVEKFLPKSASKVKNYTLYFLTLS